MTEPKKKLARLLIKLSYKEGDFTLTSGKKSDYSFDCKQTVLNAAGTLVTAAERVRGAGLEIVGAGCPG